jgi:predicted TIM-barrel fold metal-dependent hydrolase
MHEAGVRGIRLNLETEGISDAAYARRQLQWAARRVGPLGWHVQIFTNPAVLAEAGDTIAGLGVPVVVDHFGRAAIGRTAIGRAAVGRTATDASSKRSGLDVLLDLLRSGAAWVKLSAPYRLSGGPDSPQVRELAQALIEANPERMLWGTDWPHPGGERRGPVHVIEPFRPIDDGRALNRLAEWAPDRALLEKILVHNPARLYDYR